MTKLPDYDDTLKEMAETLKTTRDPNTQRQIVLTMQRLMAAKDKGIPLYPEHSNI